MDARWPRRRWIPIVVLVIGFACTAGVCAQIARVQRAREQERFARAVLHTESEIDRRMGAYVAMLRATTGLFLASDYVSRGEFARFIDQLELQTEYPGIRAIGYSERAPDTASLTQRLREEYGSEFSLHSPGEALEHHAVIFIEPLDAVNRATVGFNMFTDPVRRVAMERAGDRAEPVASGVVNVLPELGLDPQRGFVIVAPFYSTPDPPPTVEERRRRLVGFIYAPFHVHDLFGAIFAETNAFADFALYDADVPDPQALVFASPMFIPSLERAGRLGVVSDIQVGGRTWTAKFVPGSGFTRHAAGGIIPLVAGSGALISLLLFGLVRVQTRAAEHFERLAGSLSDSQRELLDSEARKSAILESALDAIITMDRDGRILEWNPAAERIFGWGRDHAVGTPIDELILPDASPPGPLGRIRESLARTPGPPAGERIETIARRADGSTFPVEMSLCRVGDADPPRFTGFLRDITEHARLEHHRELMTRELDHRVKNNLSSVLAIVSESARHSPSVAHLVRSVSERLRALSGLHEMLAARNWEGAELGELVARTLSPYCAENFGGTPPDALRFRLDDPPPGDGAAAGAAAGAVGESRIAVSGPPVALSGRLASSVCMALHELATNASKYGALSVAGGRVDLSWRTEIGEPGVHWLVLTWKERDGPPVHAPTHRGFGSELIEGGIAFETGGNCAMDYATDGLVCKMRVPLSSAEPETSHAAAFSFPAPAP